jgi:hypothetical protein
MLQNKFCGAVFRTCTEADLLDLAFIKRSLENKE